MTRPVSLGLLAGLVLSLVAAANHRRSAEARLDPATITELSRRLDLVVSGGSSALPSLSRDPNLAAANRNRSSDHR